VTDALSRVHEQPQYLALICPIGTSFNNSKITLKMMFRSNCDTKMDTGLNMFGVSLDSLFILYSQVQVAEWLCLHGINLKPSFCNPTVSLSVEFTYSCSIILTICSEQKTWIKARNHLSKPRVTKLFLFFFWQTRVTKLTPLRE
jgi:hypothetical protein